LRILTASLNAWSRRRVKDVDVVVALEVLVGQPIVVATRYVGDGPERVGESVVGLGIVVQIVEVRRELRRRPQADDVRRRDAEAHQVDLVAIDDVVVVAEQVQPQCRGVGERLG